MAERKARASPSATCEGVFSGKVPRLSDAPPERSEVEIRMMPKREARTPISFWMVKVSMCRMAPKRRVKTEEVEVRIVEEATVVYLRQAATK